MPIIPSDASIHDFPHIFDHFVSSTGARFRSSEPRVDVLENGSTTTFVLNIPGVPKSSLDITVHEGVLTVSGSWGSAHAEAFKVEVEERPKGAFKRVFRVPSWLTATGIKAKLEDGVLRIDFEKRTGDKDAEKVQVM